MVIDKRVAYIYSQRYNSLVDQLPQNINRASIVHGLIQAYSLDQKMQIIGHQHGSMEDLCTFHDPDYVEYLLKCEQEDDFNEEYGLQDDCPPVENMGEYIQLLGGASIQAAGNIVENKCDICIHWNGGRHHAQMAEASGFCYFNDVVTSALRLRSHFKRVLIIDIDAHHGDGTQDAFYYSDSVFCVSFHRFEPGFFPSTGSMQEIGAGKGKFCNLNIPLKEGLTQKQYQNIYDHVISECLNNFSPDCVILVAGADGLANDPARSLNLTDLSFALDLLLQQNVPLLLLGAGGYNNANTARCWTLMTARCLKETLCEQIPYHGYYSLYQPSYELSIHANHMKNSNTDEDIQCLRNHIEQFFCGYKEFHVRK
ncbi:hypothetical protein MP228_005107 [Amoeboaphelidium protococcarum]|nr:hypothetical protein MP228_005107 [Amoeboaphelidium protococcarum]